MPYKAEIFLLVGFVLAVFALFVLLPGLIQHLKERRIQAELDSLARDIEALRATVQAVGPDDYPGGPLTVSESNEDQR